MNQEPGLAIIVDDNPGVRHSLEALLSSAGLVTRSHERGSELLEFGLPTGPACVLLDLRMPGESGIQIQQSLRALDPYLPVIFLSGDADVRSAVLAMRDGAQDFLEKGNVSPNELIRRVVSAVQDHRMHLEAAQRTELRRTRIRNLSPREREVAILVARGKANKVVARDLGISERTVEIHRGHAMRKLGLRSVTDLARLIDELNHESKEDTGET